MGPTSFEHGVEGNFAAALRSAFLSYDSRRALAFRLVTLLSAVSHDVEETL
jgi:hypothetical protein